MSLALHYHPLSSFCWKVLIPLYENGTQFEPKLLNLQDPAEVAAFRALWPVGKMPILVDEDHDRVITETSIMIEWLVIIIIIIIMERRASCPRIRSARSRCGSGTGFTTSMSSTPCSGSSSTGSVHLNRGFRPAWRRRGSC